MITVIIHRDYIEIESFMRERNGLFTKRSYAGSDFLHEKGRGYTIMVSLRKLARDQPPLSTGAAVKSWGEKCSFTSSASSGGNIRSKKETSSLPMNGTFQNHPVLLYISMFRSVCLFVYLFLKRPQVPYTRICVSPKLLSMDSRCFVMSSPFTSSTPLLIPPQQFITPAWTSKPAYSFLRTQFQHQLQVSPTWNCRKY